MPATKSYRALPSLNLKKAIEYLIFQLNISCQNDLKQLVFLESNTEKFGMTLSVGKQAVISKKNVQKTWQILS